MAALTHGSLFTGIGGFDLGFERAGIKTLWQVEIDDYATKVLEKHWPSVPRYRDITTLDWGTVPRPDILSGGFPCQDISHAGKRAGITGSRSGLWVEFRRSIDALRPRYVVVENVAALYQRGLDTVLGDLAASGYDAEWDCLPAASVGAPHLRERIFIVAYPTGERLEKQILQSRLYPWQSKVSLPYPKSIYVQRFFHRQEKRELRRSDWWLSEPNVGRVAHGVSHRVDRLKCLGNAVVPQIAEYLGRLIVAAETNAHHTS